MTTLEVPAFLKKRFSRMNSLAWQYLYPEEERRKVLRRLKTKSARKEQFAVMRSEVKELSQILFLFAMYKFFKDGTEAAIKAVDVFKGIDVPGYSVGSEIFEERNEVVMRGSRLAESMLENIQNEEISRILRESQHMYQIVDEFKKVKDGR